MWWSKYCFYEKVIRKFETYYLFEIKIDSVDMEPILIFKSKKYSKLFTFKINNIDIKDYKINGNTNDINNMIFILNKNENQI